MSVIEATSLDAAVGARLKSLRVKANLNQGDIAQNVGLSRASISNIENGRQPVTIQTLWRIAQALEVSLRDLIPEDREILPPPTVKSAASPEDDAAFVQQFKELVAGGSSGTP